MPRLIATKRVKSSGGGGGGNGLPALADDSAAQSKDAPYVLAMIAEVLSLVPDVTSIAVTVYSGRVYERRDRVAQITIDAAAPGDFTARMQHVCGALACLPGTQDGCACLQAFGRYGESDERASLRLQLGPDTAVGGGAAAADTGSCFSVPDTPPPQRMSVKRRHHRMASDGAAAAAAAAAESSSDDSCAQSDDDSEEDGDYVEATPPPPSPVPSDVGVPDKGASSDPDHDQASTLLHAEDQLTHFLRNHVDYQRGVGKGGMRLADMHALYLRVSAALNYNDTATFAVFRYNIGNVARGLFGTDDPYLAKRPVNPGGTRYWPFACKASTTALLEGTDTPRSRRRLRRAADSDADDA